MCALVTGVQTLALPISRVRGGRGSVRQRQSAIDAEARPCPRRRAARLRARRADGRRICPAAGQESNRRHRQRGEGTGAGDAARVAPRREGRSEEHTSELQSLMRISYAVFCLKTKKINRV